MCVCDSVGVVYALVEQMCVCKIRRTPVALLDHVPLSSLEPGSLIEAGASLAAGETP